MKLDGVPRDGKLHTYCLRCRQETTQAYRAKGCLMQRCTACGYVDARALIIDPRVNWWLDGSGEYWHETAGVFVRDERGRCLFFERTAFPFGLTVPAGHVDRGERPSAAARRELREETGLALDDGAFAYVGTKDVPGDQCRRGSDAHRWHVYMAQATKGVRVDVDRDEGVRPVWLAFDEVLRREELLFAVRRIIATMF